MTAQPTSTFYTEIVQRLNAVRRKQNGLALIYGALTVLLIAFVVVLIASVLENIFSFGTIGRAILFGAAIVSIAGAVAWFIVRPLLYAFGVLKSEDNHALALKVPSHFPLIRDRLLDALEMYEQKEHLRQHYSLSLIDASFSDLYQNIQPLNFVESVSDSRVRKARKLVLYSAAMFALLFVIPQLGFVGSLYRVVNYSKSFAAPLPIEFVVEPGNTDAVRGQTVPVSIHTQG